MSSNVVITVEHVTQRYRVIQERPDTLRELFTRFFRHESEVYDFEAVRDVSFTVHGGEMLGIVGRNGSGKSTLLKVVAGVFRPTLGKVKVAGTIAPLIELGAGFHGELTGRENILINGLILGYSKKEMLHREQSIIDFAEIGDFIDVPVKQYSSGMYMRLAFAVATEVDPDILVIDEILAVGDFAFQQKCKERLLEFRRRNKTILLVTHSANDVTDLCDRAILMDQGNMLFDGNPEEALEMYKSVSVPETAGEPTALSAAPS
jgi:ABC-2 type transport system ATP-binding protein/lipopolysaccharide transport system ATP-binding protein